MPIRFYRSKGCAYKASLARRFYLYVYIILTGCARNKRNRLESRSIILYTYIRARAFKANVCIEAFCECKQYNLHIGTARERKKKRVPNSANTVTNLLQPEISNYTYTYIFIQLVIRGGHNNNDSITHFLHIFSDVLRCII